MSELGDGRTEIPLRMLTGNLDVLLEGPLHVNTIQLNRDPASPFGVILAVTLSDAQREEANRRGFKTTNINTGARITGGKRDK